MILADAWNKLVAQVKRARPLRGVRADTKEQPRGVIVSGDANSLWRHPWFINARYEFKDDGTGEWRAFIRPGFVNGRDGYITVPADRPDGKAPEDGSNNPHDVPLTDDTHRRAIDTLYPAGDYESEINPEGEGGWTKAGYRRVFSTKRSDGLRKNCGLEARPICDENFASRVFLFLTNLIQHERSMLPGLEPRSMAPNTSNI